MQIYSKRLRNKSYQMFFFSVDWNNNANENNDYKLFTRVFVYCLPYIFKNIKVYNF